jgi:hypothetical protein
MSLYRFLQDHFINNQTYLAGTTASTTDAGGSLPSGFIPTVAMEPLDGAAVTAFWTAQTSQDLPVEALETWA